MFQFAAVRAGHGVCAAENSIGRDFGAFNVRVNAVRLGWIHGAPVRAYIEALVAAGNPREQVVGEIVNRFPLGVIPPEEDCAKAVLFLNSDYSCAITGASLDTNGGQCMAP